jgi:hypothetical protein
MHGPHSLILFACGSFVLPLCSDAIAPDGTVLCSVPDLKSAPRAGSYIDLEQISCWLREEPDPPESSHP